MTAIREIGSGTVLHQEDEAELRFWHYPDKALRRADLSGLYGNHWYLQFSDFTGSTFCGSVLQSLRADNCTFDHCDFTRCTMTGAELYQAKIREAILCRAVLDEAYCESADFSGSDLRQVSARDANLSFALLEECDLRSADLSGARLRPVGLERANFSRARFEQTVISTMFSPGVDLSEAYFHQTLLYNCVGLHRARGLESIVHGAPSCLDYRTLVRSARYLPEVFLAGCGYSSAEIEGLRRHFDDRLAQQLAAEEEHRWNLLQQSFEEERRWNLLQQSFAGG